MEAQQPKLMKPRSPASKTSYASDPEISNKVYSLYDLVNQDESANLVAKHPSTALNAAQKVWSWINFVKPRKMPDPEFQDGEIIYYPVFSAGIPEAGHKRIHGQYKVIESFADHVKSAALHGAAKKMLLLVGPAGTGKTHFLNILSSLAENLTATKPEHYVFRYEWVGLSKFPPLEPLINIQRSGNKTYEHPFKCPINESPLNLIPEEYLSGNS